MQPGSSTKLSHFMRTDIEKSIKVVLPGVSGEEDKRQMKAQEIFDSDLDDGDVNIEN